MEDSKECAKMLILLLASSLEAKLDDVMKENLPNWKMFTKEEKKKMLCSIAKYWLKEEINN
jgi:hypothetical protein